MMLIAAQRRVYSGHEEKPTGDFKLRRESNEDLVAGRHPSDKIADKTALLRFMQRN
jgi:hypothetical protein